MLEGFESKSDNFIALSVSFWSLYRPAFKVKHGSHIFKIHCPCDQSMMKFLYPCNKAINMTLNKVIGETRTARPSWLWNPIWRLICAVIYPVTLSLFSGSTFSCLDNNSISFSISYPLSHRANLQNLATNQVHTHTQNVIISTILHHFRCWLIWLFYICLKWRESKEAKK